MILRASTCVLAGQVGPKARDQIDDVVLPILSVLIFYEVVTYFYPIGKKIRKPFYKGS
jgi:hypothetical protein